MTTSLLGKIIETCKEVKQENKEEFSQIRTARSEADYYQGKVLECEEMIDSLVIFPARYICSLAKKGFNYVARRNLHSN